MRNYHILKRMPKTNNHIKQNRKPKFWESSNSEEVEQLEVSYNSDESKDVPKVHTFWRAVCQILITLNLSFSYNLAIPLLGIYLT